MRRVTVGIPAYNEEQNIASLLHSLEGQRSLISEVIVSDDSSDRTPDIVRNFARRSPLGITLFHHDERRGAAMSLCSTTLTPYRTRRAPSSLRRECRKEQRFARQTRSPSKPPGLLAERRFSFQTG
jgi:cellulose synthase/poly-beta-1,6-N-acetylglucosamine synthase-like glycosyltransferase